MTIADLYPSFHASRATTPGGTNPFQRSAKNCLIVGAFFLIGCSPKTDDKLFQEQLAVTTGIDFENKVIETEDNNVLNYPYYYNGGGVAIGDINQDGLPDIYFSGNLVANRLYLNKGNFKFEDITQKAGVAVGEGWKTGVTLADVNQDGWLDIYVCRSGMADSLLRKNLLFINNRDQTFSEQADAYGVADKSYSTHASFFDYDKDGDLDLFVLNHSLPRYAGFSNMLVNFKKQKGSKFQSKLFQNNLGKFNDVSEKAGIVNNVLSFGLGVAISDVNQDGWPDIYVSNDFNEEDYLYINNQDGTFINAVREAMGHVSLFSMGSDIADINNDTWPDIFTLDMLPETNERIKLSSGDDNYDKYRILIDAGFHHQSMRNMLQLNNGDGTFSEIGQLMGISNTDWSWSALFADFDGDGWKDLFVSNGYEKDYTNMQFLKYTVDEKLKSQQTGQPLDLKQIVNQMPPIEVGNFLFRNNGDLTFTKTSEEWGISRTFKSNGAAYADLDTDGDLDLIINAMNEPAVVYRNNSIENSKAVFLNIDLVKRNPMQNVIGTKVFVYAGDVTQYQEFSPSRGFQSCMYVPINVGMNGKTVADSIRIVWTDNRTQLFKNIPIGKVFAPEYKEAPDLYVTHAAATPLFIPNETIVWEHAPPDINDFKRQFMLPRMYSPSGPRMTDGDVNHDGLVDIYICGAKDQGGALFLQQKNGVFKIKETRAFENDKGSQDEDARLVDVDNDGDPDLYVVSGGYAFDEKDPMLQDRLYLNDGFGNFKKAAGALPTEVFAGSCVEPFDIDGDHDIDLFVGSRLVPGHYPAAPQNMLLVNDGKGNFTNQINQYAPGLEDAGMVCDAQTADFNNDGKPDLVVAGEWMPLKILINTGNTLADETEKWFSSSTKGLWNCVIAADFDNDGDQDLVAGNYGLNNQFNVTPQHPVTLVYKDFGNDKQVDLFFCYYINGTSYPFASRDEALGQVGFLKPRFPDYTSYSSTTLETIFSVEELNGATTLRADLFKTVYMENKGNSFAIKDLPIQAQFSPVHSIAGFDIDQDGDKDLVMGGNETNVRVRLGKTDANRGFVFLNDGQGGFSYTPQNQSGLDLAGDVRQLLFINSHDHTYLLSGETQGPIRSYVLREMRESKPPL